MTEQDPRTTEAEPFAPVPRRPGAPAGCGKPLLVGCGVLAILLTITLVVLVLKTSDLMAWSLTQFRTAVAQKLPEEVTPAERQRLDSAFEAAVEAFRNGNARAEAMPELQQALMGIVGRVDRLTREDVGRLIRALEGVAGVEGETIEERPQPEAEPEAPALTAA